ncbi:uncharacterized protein AMSG_08100 [Thecamonas trahens ATCC 50062]|uniref:Uncharacterized protein n=1 Tax=Thecamonas trahens ATCC 50062 TaxID=461836 RepID=A0A0L0DJE9_THETB|nr:hypothetical protein AMSG_08100 [Thecamonas trahens ATCC 50062]KNC52534.1 hypothetical protein AMSG_08100 [Thecamonas trahens ATCC 50062]|eukprot:XP_013755326.1 hypothetical protein AMSG_08100 [Thecamonas trahens ATCC 50062]
MAATMDLASDSEPLTRAHPSAFAAGESVPSRKRRVELSGPVRGKRRAPLLAAAGMEGTGGAAVSGEQGGRLLQFVPVAAGEGVLYVAHPPPSRTGFGWGGQGGGSRSGSGNGGGGWSPGEKGSSSGGASGGDVMAESQTATGALFLPLSDDLLINVAKYDQISFRAQVTVFAGEEAGKSALHCGLAVF